MSSITSLVASPAPTIEDVFRALDAPDFLRGDRPEKLHDGVYAFDLYGPEGKPVSIRALSTGDTPASRVIAMRVQIYAINVDDPAEMIRTAESLFQRRMTIQEREPYTVARFDVRDECLMPTWIHTVKHSYDSVDLPPDLPPRVSAAAELLSDPLEDGSFGHSCGFVSQTPTESTAVDALLKAERYDVLQAVLRSPRPVGQAFAAEALLLAGRLTAADEALLRLLAQSDATVKRCGGCVVSIETLGRVIDSFDAPFAKGGGR